MRADHDSEQYIYENCVVDNSSRGGRGAILESPGMFYGFQIRASFGVVIMASLHEKQPWFARTMPRVHGLKIAIEIH